MLLLESKTLPKCPIVANAKVLVISDTLKLFDNWLDTCCGYIAENKLLFIKVTAISGGNIFLHYLMRL